jgi:hypothetical protein
VEPRCAVRGQPSGSCDRGDNQDPDDTFVAIAVPDDDEAFIESFRSLLEPQAQAVEEMAEHVRRDGWPQAMLALAGGRPYTKVLAHRAVGFVPLASPDPAVVELETKVATSALAAGTVVIDLSAVASGWYHRTGWTKLVNSFWAVHVTSASRRDAAESSEAVGHRSTNVLSWDTRAGRPVLYENDEADVDRLEAHVRWITEETTAMSLLDAPTGGVEPDDPLRRDAWLTVIEAARSYGLALWADDRGLRVVARQRGVATFGTDSLLYALRSTGRIGDDELAEAVTALRDEFCTDFPLDAEWIWTRAEAGSWKRGPAMLALARPLSWADPSAAFEIWDRIVGAVASADITAVPAWVYVAASGGGPAMPDLPSAMGFAASLLVRAASAVAGDPEVFAACAQGAAHACGAIGLPDPTQLALNVILDLGTSAHDRETAVQALLNLGASLIGDQQVALQHVVAGDEPAVSDEPEPSTVTPAPPGEDGN